MAHAIADADWPWVKRLIQDYKAGRLTRRPSGEQRPGGGHGRGLKLGRAIEPIEKGKTGSIKRLTGEQGKEKPDGNAIEAYNRFGDIEANSDLLYTRVSGKIEIVQSWCDPFEFSDEDAPPPDAPPEGGV